jgi:predicted DNA-binding transcriptional regulator YafY
VVFHLLKNCDEVSYKEVTDLAAVSKKTVYRDVRLLVQAGCVIRFSKERKTFVMDRGLQEAQMPEKQNARRHLQKIVRLLTLMTSMNSAADPVAWYRGRYPLLSVRTMQRDFKTLNRIGYCVAPVEDDPEYGARAPGRRYYCEWPMDAYDLKLFRGESRT